VSDRIKIDRYLPHYYAGASGDFNLIHIDPAFGRAAGLGGNILQGLCTLGITANRLIGDEDPARLKSITVRFAFPVLPEDELLLETDEKDGEVKFTVRKVSGEEVITKGRSVYR
jgi:acyl dehydratase|tara:strand:- start:185 stop:526 length:342 start_codon:yes stop_codon:yes gene_type:complete